MIVHFLHHLQKLALNGVIVIPQLLAGGNLVVDVVTFIEIFFRLTIMIVHKLQPRRHFIFGVIVGQILVLD